MSRRTEQSGKSAASSAKARGKAPASGAGGASSTEPSAAAVADGSASLPVHISTIQYSPRPTPDHALGSGYVSGDDDSSSGEDYPVRVRRAAGPGFDRKAISALTAEDFTRTTPQQMFRFKPGDPHLSDTEEVAEAVARPGDERLAEPAGISALFQELGGDEPAQVSVLQNRQRSLFARHNQGFEQPTAVHDDRLTRRSKLFRRQWRGVDPGVGVVPQEAVESHSRRLRRQARSVQAPGDGFLAGIEAHLDGLQRDGATVPYSQLRDWNLQRQKPRITAPAALVTMDDDIAPIDGDRPAREALDALRDPRVRRAAVPYTYGYDADDESISPARRRMARDVTRVDAEARRFQAESGGSPYAPEPLQAVRLRHGTDVASASFLDGTGESVRESEHLRASLAIEPAETHWTRASYRTRPQAEFERRMPSWLADPAEGFSRALHGYPQSHSNTNDLARGVLDAASVRDDRTAWTSVLSEHINQEMLFTGDDRRMAAPRAGAGRGRGLSEVMEARRRRRDKHAARISARAGWEDRAGVLESASSRMTDRLIAAVPSDGRGAGSRGRAARPGRFSAAAAAAAAAAESSDSSSSSGSAAPAAVRRRKRSRSSSGSAAATAATVAGAVATPAALGHRNKMPRKAAGRGGSSVVGASASARSDPPAAKRAVARKSTGAPGRVAKRGGRGGKGGKGGRGGKSRR